MPQNVVTTGNVVGGPFGPTPIDNLQNGNILPIVPFVGTVVADGSPFMRGTPLEVIANVDTSGTDPVTTSTNTYKRAVDAIHAILPIEIDDTTDNVDVQLWGMGQFNQNVMDMSTLTNVEAAIVDARSRQIYITPSKQAPYVRP
jgi:hypothetical protein